MILSLRTIACAASTLFGLCGATDINASNAQSAQILSSKFTPPQNWRNVNLVRNINLVKNYPRETINVVIENVGKGPEDQYYLPFEASLVGRVGGLEVRDKNNADAPPFHVETVEFDPYSPTTYYMIRLPSTVSPGSQQTLTITYSVLSALTPLPAQIEQAERQFVQYNFSAYMPSAYTTLKQKTKLKFPSAEVPNYTVLENASGLSENEKDPKVEGSSFTYGPFKELPAGAVMGAVVRYEFTRPLNHISLLERDIEVSHWGGNLATEERYWLANRAATLKNHFSRIEWQKTNYFHPPTSALQNLRLRLRPGSTDPYFVDDIGNVSTSRWRTSDGDLELKPRYPVFGNWHYKFKVGWNFDLKNSLRKAKTGETYVLRVPFMEGPTGSDGFEYEKVVLRVILPEGATNVKFETDIPIVTDSISSHHTFMDTTGRTMLTLTAFNLVDDHREKDLIITYDYPYLAGFRKPITVVAAVFGIFLAAAGLGMVDVRIGKGKRA